MEDLIDTLTRGNPTEVKVVLATVALALKVAVVRRFHGLGRLLPAIGASIWVLLALTWLTSAGDFLADR